jgi:hypothetical protein
MKRRYEKRHRGRFATHEYSTKELEELDGGDPDAHAGKQEQALWEYVDAQEVVDLLRRIEQHRQAITREQATLQDWLRGAPDLAKEWETFTGLGGVTSTELERYFAGQIFRHRPIRQRRHLRLISNKAALRDNSERSSTSESGLIA